MQIDTFRSGRIEGEIPKVDCRQLRVSGRCWARKDPFLPSFSRFWISLWPTRCCEYWSNWRRGEDCVSKKKVRSERRKWARLPLAIPVFVRSRDDKGKECLEFATALNVSAGGMLVAVRRVLAPAAAISLEIPSAPLATLAPLPRAARNLRAKALRMTHAEGYHLLGLKFLRPLLNSTNPNLARRRKLSSVV